MRRKLSEAEKRSRRAQYARSIGPPEPEEVIAGTGPSAERAVMHRRLLEQARGMIDEGGKRCVALHIQKSTTLSATEALKAAEGLLVCYFLGTLSTGE